VSSCVKRHDRKPVEMRQTDDKQRNDETL